MQWWYRGSDVTDAGLEAPGLAFLGTGKYRDVCQEFRCRHDYLVLLQFLIVKFASMHVYSLFLLHCYFVLLRQGTYYVDQADLELGLLG